MVQAISLIMASLNIMGSEDEKSRHAVSTFGSFHRTMQQTFIRVVLMPILVHLAKQYQEGNFDLRNGASCRIASKMLDALTEEDRYIPFI